MATKARIALRVLIYALALLSVAAGIPKALQMPQEVGFLSAIGFSAVVVSLLGLVQVAGGILLIFARTRFAGAVLAGLALLISSIALFLGGDSLFGTISLLPFAIALLVIYLELRDPNRHAA